jgi:hypothetical protein
MGFIRLTSGRDAADCAYASIFGDVTPTTRLLQIEAVPTLHGMPPLIPYRIDGAISTASD